MNKKNSKKLKPNRKRINMIEIRGISGLLKLAFIAVCAIAGFIVNIVASCLLRSGFFMGIKAHIHRLYNKQYSQEEIYHTKSKCFMTD